MTLVKQRNKIPFLCGIKSYVLPEKCFGNLCLGLAVDKLKIMMRPQHFNYNYFAQIRASLVLIMWTDFLLTTYIYNNLCIYLRFITVTLSKSYKKRI